MGAIMDDDLQPKKPVMNDQPEALRLADELERPVGTQSTYSAMQQAAAELRRLHGEVKDADWAYDSAAKRADTMEQERDKLRAEVERLREDAPGTVAALREMRAKEDDE